MTVPYYFADRKVLVTGGGGFLGAGIVRALIAQGAVVRSFSRRSHGRLNGLAVEQVQGDLSDGAAVDAACQGMQVVFHVAAKAGVWGAYDDFYKPNVIGTEHVIAACRRHAVAQLVYTSSPSVVFDGGDMEGVDESVPYPQTYHAHYPRTKAMAEQAVRQAAADGLSAIILRPHLIWGPEDNHLVPQILARAHRVRRIGDGSNRVDTTYIDNAVTAHMLAGEKLAQNPDLSGRVYFISQGEPVPLWEMIDQILAAAKMPPVKGQMSVATARRIGTVLEWVFKILPLGEPPLNRFAAQELGTAHWFDISAARNDLGYDPKVSIAEGLRRLAAWLDAQQKSRSAAG